MTCVQDPTHTALDPLPSLVEGLFANSSEAVVTVDGEGVIRFLTSGAGTLLAIDPEAAVGMSIFDFLHPDDADEVSELFTRRWDYDGADLGHDMRLRKGVDDWVMVNVTATLLPDTTLGAMAFTLGSMASDSKRVHSLRRKLVVEEYCTELGAGFMEAKTSSEILARLQTALEELGLLTGADAASTFLERHQGDALERMVRWVSPQFEGLGHETIGLNLGPELIENALTRPFSSNHFQADHRSSDSALAGDIKATGLLSAPFMAGTQRGLLVLMRYRFSGTWTEDDLQLVRRVADLAGRALHMARSEELLMLTYQEGPIGFSLRTYDGVLVDCNQRYLELQDLTRERAQTVGLAELLHPDDTPWVLDRVAQLLAGDVDRLQHDARILTADGKYRWMRTNVVRLQSAGSSEPYVLTSLEDVTEVHDQRKALEHAATHDSLTGVANRESMRRAIDKFADEHDRLPNLLLIDLDRFKLVNDSLGHMTGDLVLRAVADRIKSCVRSVDLLARFGGDEFAVVVPDMEARHTHHLAERIRRSMESPLVVDGCITPQTISIGVAIGGECADTAELLVRADRAMYVAKSRGRNRCVVFDDVLRDEGEARNQLERDLRYAVDHGELAVHFQPEFAVNDCRIVGAEALLRWNHPKLGCLDAGHFIDVAEQTGMIDDIGRFALREGCRSFAEVIEETQRPDLMLRVNISAREFARPEMPDLVRSALSNSGIAPDALCLEMTETTLMDSPEVTLDTFSRLRGIGVEFAIDDFGTGYSSLAYLKRFPVDALKIDRSFVEDITNDSDSLAIVESIMGLSHALSLGVVAEGVETAEQLQTLRNLGCSRAQGFLVSEAKDSESFMSMLAS